LIEDTGENTRVIRDTLLWDNPDWAPVPIEIHQNVSERRITKVVVVATTGWLELLPLEGSKTRFATVGGRESTVLDFQSNKYHCPEGTSGFRLEETRRR